MGKFKRKYYLNTKLGDQHGYTHGIYNVILFRKVLGIYIPIKRYTINCLIDQPHKSSYKIKPNTTWKKRVSNQDDENAKYHLDINGVKSQCEKDFDPATYNVMTGKEQRVLIKEKFPLGSKVYTNLNCKPTECVVLGYEMKSNGSSDICNLLTNYNEVEKGYRWEQDGNTSMHPGWFYPKSNRENNLDSLLLCY